MIDYVNKITKMNYNDMIKYARGEAQRIAEDKVYDTDLNYMKFLIDICTDYSMAHCKNCRNEDFGRCSLRFDNISDNKKYVDICLQQLLEFIKNK